MFKEFWEEIICSINKIPEDSVFRKILPQTSKFKIPRQH